VGGTLLELLTRNLVLKVAAFGMALLLWVSVRAERQDRRTIPSVPVQVELSDSDWTLRGDPLPATVEIRVSGPARELFQLALERPVVVVPVDQVAAGDTAIVLSREWVRMGSHPGVSIDDIQPSSIRISLDRVASAWRPVAPRIQGELPSDLVLARDPTPEPSSVRILGPAGRVQEMDSIRLLPVDLGRVRGDQAVRVAVDTSGFGRVRVSPDTVTLRFPVETPAERILTNVPLELLPEGVLSDVELPETAISVVLRGAREAVESVTRGDIRAVVDVVGLLELEPGEEMEVPVRIEGLPALVTGRSNPVRVTVRRRTSQESADQAAADAGADSDGPEGLR
jgi:YbbR domain-containing protein